MTLLEIISMLSEYYGKELNDTQISIYSKTLSDIPVSILKTTAYDWIAASKWFPKVAELRDMAGRVKSNNEMALGYDEFESDNHSSYLYWQVQGAFCDALAGRIGWEELDKIRGIKRYFPDVVETAEQVRAWNEATKASGPG